MANSRGHLFMAHDLRANAFRVCREGKPLHTFPDHALPITTQLQVQQRHELLAAMHVALHHAALGRRARV